MDMVVAAVDPEDVDTAELMVAISSTLNMPGSEVGRRVGDGVGMGEG